MASIQPMASTPTKKTDEWIHDIFPATYPDHLPSFLPLRTCVKPSGQKVAVWDRLFYLQHRTDATQSFFIVEYGIPLRKGAVDMIARYVYETRHVFSKIGHETSTLSAAYDAMVQELRGTTLQSFDLPIHILLTHPLKPTMIKYLQAIHEGICPYTYDELAWSLCASDGQQCVFDDMMVVNRGIWDLNRVYHGNRMSEVREWLEENDLIHRVDPRAKPYLLDYSEIERQLFMLMGCVEVRHLVLRKAGKGT
jgi:hypothetical protein